MPPRLTNDKPTLNQMLWCQSLCTARNKLLTTPASRCALLLLVVGTPNGGYIKFSVVVNTTLTLKTMNLKIDAYVWAN